MTDAVGAQEPELTKWRLTRSQLWALVAVGLPFIGLLGPPLSTIDLAYQVRAGDIMLGTHHLIRVDPFSFTAAGRPWFDQQWGAQLVFAVIYRAGGWAALVLTRAFLGGLIYLLVFLACRATGVRTKAASGLALASLFVSFPGLILRPQLLGMTLFALTVYIVAERHQHPAMLWIIPVLVAIWANVHGSFFLGPLLMAFAYLGDRSTHNPKARRVLGVGAASVLAANLNPFGLRVWSYALELSTNPQITHTIQEWEPTTIRSAPGVVFFVSVLAVVAVLARRGGPSPLPSLLTLGVFFFIGLFAVRGIYWWALAVPPIIAGLLPQDPTGRPAASSDPPSVVNSAVALGLIVLAVALLPWWRESGSSQSLLGDAPLKLTTALEEALGPADRMFNPQIWGSWFEFSLPQHPVFVDSRIEVFPDAVWRDYDSVSAGQEGWQAILDRWSIDLVVANPVQQAGLIPRIREDPTWHLAYQDQDGFVFVRAS